jgi:hypothetical protein
MTKPILQLGDLVKAIEDALALGALGGTAPRIDGEPSESGTPHGETCEA